MPVAVPYKPYKNLDKDIQAIVDSIEVFASLASRGLGTYDGQTMQGSLKLQTGLLAIKEVINGNFSLIFEAQKAAAEILHPEFGKDCGVMRMSDAQSRLLRELEGAVGYALRNGIDQNKVKIPGK